jgi:hypothetical protein
MYAFGAAMAIDVKVGAGTVTDEFWVNPIEEAEIVTEPIATPVTMPVALTVATLVADEPHVTPDVRGWFEPSE